MECVSEMAKEVKELNLWGKKEADIVCVEDRTKEIYAVQEEDNSSRKSAYASYIITRMTDSGAYIDHMFICGFGEITSMGAYYRDGKTFLLLNCKFKNEEKKKVEIKIVETQYKQNETLFGLKDGRLLHAYTCESSKISFADFKEEALERLQLQFLGTDNTKDTVMTRKNIIEMINDLKTIN